MSCLLTTTTLLPTTATTVVVVEVILLAYVPSCLRILACSLSYVDACFAGSGVTTATTTATPPTVTPLKTSTLMSYADTGTIQPATTSTIAGKSCQNSATFVTSAKKVMFSSLFVCLSVSNFAQKLLNRFA